MFLFSDFERVLKILHLRPLTNPSRGIFTTYAGMGSVLFILGIHFCPKLSKALYLGRLYLDSMKRLFWVEAYPGKIKVDNMSV